MQLRQHSLAARDPQALQTARGLEARDGTRKLRISGIDLDDVVVEAQDRATPRLVGQQPQALAVRGDLDIGALEIRSELDRVMCERGHADVEWQPLDQGLELGLVVERAKRGRPAVHHLGEPAVLRLAGPGLEVAASGDRRDRIEVTVADPHVVMHDEALARLVAKVPDRHARERRIPTEFALQHERHRIRVEQSAHLRQRGVARRPDPRGRHAHVGRGCVANAPQVAGKLLRRTLTRDAPVCHLDHAIRGTRERRRMGDHDRGTPAHQRIEAFHHCRLALGVETGRRLVEHEDRRVAQDRAGNRDPLTLAAREAHPSLPEHGRIAVGELLDELMGGRSLGRSDDLLRIRLDAIRDVVRDRAREEDALLQHEPDLVANPAQTALAQIVPVDQHAPVERVIEPGNQRRERRLAGTRATDHRNALAGGDEQRESVQRRTLAVVAEDHAVKLDLAGGATSVVAVLRVVEHVVGREDLGHAIGPRERLRDPAPLARDCAERTVDLSRIHDHDRQQAKLEIAAVNAEGADHEHEGDPDLAGEVDHPGKPPFETRGADAGVPSLGALRLEPGPLVLLRPERLHLADGPEHLAADRGDLALAAAHLPGGDARTLAEPEAQQREHGGDCEGAEREHRIDVHARSQHEQEDEERGHQCAQRAGEDVADGVDVAGDPRDEVARLQPGMERDREALQLRVDRKPELVDDALPGQLEPQVRLIGRNRLGRGNPEHRQAHVADREVIRPREIAQIDLGTLAPDREHVVDEIREGQRGGDVRRGDHERRDRCDQERRPLLLHVRPQDGQRRRGVDRPLAAPHAGHRAAGSSESSLTASMMRCPRLCQVCSAASARAAEPRRSRAA